MHPPLTPEPATAPKGILRRSLLAGASALAGCSVIRPIPAPGPNDRRIADAHVHLFNAADLPVRKFIELVIIPERAPGAPGWVKAVVDLFATVVKDSAISAAHEASRFTAVLGADTITPQGFGDRVAKRIDEAAKADATSRDARVGQVNLTASYRLLSQLVAEDSGPVLAARSARDRQAAPDQARPVDLSLARDGFSAVARRADSGAPFALGELVRQSRGDDRGFVADAVRLVGWAYMMTQSRRTHLDRYLRAMAAPAMRPTLLVNHMVDFDRWLGEGPGPGSAPLEQISLMTRIAREARPNVEIATFAGFCPLKHAMELASGTSRTTLMDLQAAFVRGDIRGFKLYPPMGFQPIGNAALMDTDFTSETGVGKTVLTRWQGVSQKPLGPALDASLRIFYTWCIGQDVPLMAHAGPGNQAGWNFGQRANPIWWEKVAEEFPGLRLSIGHLVSDPQSFVDAAPPPSEPQPPLPDDVWALHAPLRLIGDKPGHEGRIFGDLAYMPELVQVKGLAKRFFEALDRKFSPVDPGLRHILYGTDWVFLGLEAQYDNYLATLIAAMQAAKYTPEMIDNITSRNARRFMKLPG